MRLSILPLLAATAIAQTPIDGDVVDALTGAPLAGALVSPLSIQPNVSTVASDAAGHFRLSAPPGFNLRVTHAGHLLCTFRASAGNPRIGLVPQAVIAGKLTDEDGFPVADADVNAMQYVMVDGQRRLRFTAGARSNDLGEFRIANLPAGRYYLRADPLALRRWDERYVPEYYPGSLEPREDSIVEMHAGQERGGIDFRMTRCQGVTVAGRLVAPADVKQPPVFLKALNDGLVSGARADRQAPDGTFLFRHVAPGEYKLYAQSTGPQVKAGDWLAEQPLHVGTEDLSRLRIEYRQVQPADLRGTVVFEDGAPQPIEIGLRSDYGNVTAAHTEADGSFVVKGLIPGHYTVRVNGRIYPESVQYGGAEVRQQGLDLGLDGPKPLTLRVLSVFGWARGAVLDAAGLPIANATIRIQPANGGREWAVSTNRQGEFTQGLPPGDYRVSAEFGSQKQDAAVHVVENQSRQLTLRLGRADQQ